MYDGIPSTSNNHESELDDQSCPIILAMSPNELVATVDDEVVYTTITDLSINSASTVPTESIATPQVRSRHRPKPLSVVTEKLISASNNQNANNLELVNVLKKFSDKYSDYQEKHLERIDRQLKFQIQKFKFFNPTFSYED